MSDRRVAVVTGANKGIGLEIARQLAREGIAVYIGARDEARGREAAEKLRGEGLDARPLRLDVTDEASVAAAAAFVEKDAGRLDILVNNAGIAIDDGPPSGVSMDALRRTYETNVFGLVRVTQALLPLLRRSEAGRIVNLSSGLGSLTLNSDPSWPFAVGEVPRVQQLEERGERDHRAARVGAARHEGQGERRRPGLRGDGHEPAPGRALGGAGRRDARAARDAPGRRPDRRLLQRRRAHSLVGSPVGSARGTTRVRSH